MKNTPATKNAIGSKSSSKKTGPCLPKDNSAYSCSLDGKKGKTVKRGGKRASSEGVDFENVEAFDNSLGAYLTKLGSAPLLTKAEEEVMGRKIRAEFGALLDHMLRSGFVLEVLWHRTQDAMGYKSTKPEKRAALALCSETGLAALGDARSAYAAHGRVGMAEGAALKTAFLALIDEMELWQSVGSELLDELAGAFASLEAEGTGSGNARCVAFCDANLMSFGDCRKFIKEAFELKARAVAARNQLMERNLRLVVAVARKLGRHMLPFNELIQEGNLGLLLAAERFDERLGNRFSTFAVQLIKARMKRESDNQGRTIRVPVHQAEAIRRMDKQRVALEMELGREVCEGELADKLGFTLEELEELCTLKAGVGSLQEFLQGDGETSLEEVLPDPDSVTPFYEKIDLSGKLDSYLLDLEESERRVVCCLYGLGGMPHLSLEETSQMLGLRQAEVGRVKERALATIRGAITSIDEIYACAA